MKYHVELQMIPVLCHEISAQRKQKETHCRGFNVLTGLIVLDGHFTFDFEASECVYYLQSCN